MPRKRKKSSTGPMPEPILCLGYESGIQHLTMSTHIQSAETPNPQSTSASGLFDLFNRNEIAWWPYRTISHALLITQRNAFAYMEANRKLADATHTIGRMEQNVAFELSQSLFPTLARLDQWGSSGESQEVDQAFNHAMTGIRELGEALD